MASKNFADKLKTGSTRTIVSQDAEKPKVVEPKVPIKTKGRPVKDTTKGKKRDYCKTINIAVPKDVIDDVNDLALVARGLTLTDYINLLITQDLKKNREEYKNEVARTPKFK